MAYSNEKLAVGESLSSAFGMMDGIENDILSNAVNAYHKLLVNAFEDIGETSCIISDVKCGGYPLVLDDKEVWIYCVSLNDSGDILLGYANRHFSQNDSISFLGLVKILFSTNSRACDILNQVRGLVEYILHCLDKMEKKEEYFASIGVNLQLNFMLPLPLNCDKDDEDGIRSLISKNADILVDKYKEDILGTFNNLLRSKNCYTLTVCKK
jgi:hypothetical protein